MRSSSAAVGCSVMKPSQNLLSWQVFVATCRTRSISQAAVLLDIDLPKASRLLSALETELGEPLFDKSHRPIQPTPRAAELQRAVEPLVSVPSLPAGGKTRGGFHKTAPYELHGSVSRLTLSDNAQHNSAAAML